MRLVAGKVYVVRDLHAPHRNAIALARDDLARAIEEDDASPLAAR